MSEEIETRAAQACRAHELRLLASLLVDNDLAFRFPGLFEFRNFRDPLCGACIVIAMDLISRGLLASPITIRAEFTDTPFLWDCVLEAIRSHTPGAAAPSIIPRLDELRARGWSLASHNDYSDGVYMMITHRQSGRFRHVTAADDTEAVARLLAIVSN